MFDPTKARLQGKKITVQSVVRTNVARRIVEKIVELDDKIQEITTQTVEITPDNLVSKGLRRLFGIRMLSDAPQALEDKTAKSKWHEILKRASSKPNEEAEALRRVRERMKFELEHQDKTVKNIDPKVLEDLLHVHPDVADDVHDFMNGSPLSQYSGGLVRKS